MAHVMGTAETMDRTLFDGDVDRPDPEVRRAVRRAVLGGVLHAVRTARGWSVNDAASAAGIAPMTWRRLEDGLEVRRRSLTALDSLLGNPFGSTARALDDDVTMVTLSGLAGDVYVGDADPRDPAAYLDELAERFRSGTAMLRSTPGRVTAATRARSSRPDPILEAALAAASTPLEKSSLVMAAEMIERLVREETEATENAAAALLAALPDLAANANNAFRAVAAAMLEHSGHRTLQHAASEVMEGAAEAVAAARARAATGADVERELVEYTAETRRDER